MSARPTKGPWLVTKNNLRKVTAHGVLICNAVLRNSGASKNPPSCKDQLEAEANAALIAEAGTVYHETQLTPRELADQRAELLAAAIYAVEQLADGDDPEFDDDDDEIDPFERLRDIIHKCKAGAA